MRKWEKMLTFYSDVLTDAGFSENPTTESICLNGPICFKCSLSNSLKIKDTERTWWRGKKQITETHRFLAPLE